MSPQTLHAAVTIHPSGHWSITCWRASYPGTGRQIPEWLSNELGEDPSDLAYELSEFVDMVIMAQKLQARAEENRLR